MVVQRLVVGNVKMLCKFQGYPHPATQFSTGTIILGRVAATSYY